MDRDIEITDEPNEAADFPGDQKEITTEQVASKEVKKLPGVTGGKVQAIVPADIDQAWRYSQMVMQAGMAPNSYDSPEKVMIGIVKGMELGLPPLAALQSIYVVNGRPTLWGDGALAMIQNSGLVEDFKEWWEDETAFCEIKRKNIPEPIKRTFSLEDASAANLTTKKGPWSLYPKRMCQMRARAFALRDGFADVLMGLAITEEVADYPGNTLVTDKSGRPVGVESTEIIVENPLDDVEAAE